MAASPTRKRDGSFVGNEFSNLEAGSIHAFGLSISFHRNKQAQEFCGSFLWETAGCQAFLVAGILGKALKGNNFLKNNNLLQIFFGKTKAAIAQKVADFYALFGGNGSVQLPRRGRKFFFFWFYSGVHVYRAETALLDRVAPIPAALWLTNFLVKANSPRQCPSISAVMIIGINSFPLWILIVFPIRAGTMTMSRQ